MVSLSYAKKTEGIEVDKPEAVSDNNLSESIIYNNGIGLEEYTPLNPIKKEVGVNEEEKKSVDNFNVDLKTLEKRIIYFSPTYRNIKTGAQGSYYAAYYMRGGSNDLLYHTKDYSKEILEMANEYKEAGNYVYYNATMAIYRTTNATIQSTVANLGLRSALYNIANVDNNTAISLARDQIVKSLSSVILTYLQLNSYVDILEKQTKLYKDMYELTYKNLGMGLATEVDVKNAIDTYEKSKATYNINKTTLRNVKEQICINLGYSLDDIDKLVFVEPEIDYRYLDSIVFDNDKSRAYNSNSTYLAVKMSDKDKLYPGSTGEKLFYDRQNYYAEKVTNGLEDLYAKLNAALLSYKASYILNSVCSKTEDANKRKLETNLVSKLEYDSLELMNLGDKLTVSVAKYDLINAINNYYYGTMGQVDVR